MDTPNLAPSGVFARKNWESAVFWRHLATWRSLAVCPLEYGQIQAGVECRLGSLPEKGSAKQGARTLQTRWIIGFPSQAIPDDFAKTLAILRLGGPRSRSERRKPCPFLPENVPVLPPDCVRSASSVLFIPTFFSFWPARQEAGGLPRLREQRSERFSKGAQTGCDGIEEATGHTHGEHFRGEGLWGLHVRRDRMRPRRVRLDLEQLEEKVVPTVSAMNDGYSIAFAASLTAQRGANVLDNDTGTALSATLVTQAQHGTPSVGSDGVVTYEQTDFTYAGNDYFFPVVTSNKVLVSSSFPAKRPLQYSDPSSLITSSHWFFKLLLIS